MDVASDKKIGRLFGILLNKSVLTLEVKKEIEGILGKISKEDWLEIIACVWDPASELIERVPYLSDEQTKALLDDFKSLFDKIKNINLEGCEDVFERVKERCLDLEGEIRTCKFKFCLEDIPKDIFIKSFKGEEVILQEIVEKVIEDVFGPIIKTLDSDAKLRLGFEIEHSVEGVVSKTLSGL